MRGFRSGICQKYRVFNSMFLNVHDEGIGNLGRAVVSMEGHVTHDGTEFLIALS